MINWLHRLFNPHCEHCREIDEENKVCNSCEILKEQLNSVNAERKRLLDRILEKPNENQAPIKTEEFKPIVPKNIPWNQRRQMLEAEDRNKARLEREKAQEMQASPSVAINEQTVEQLEKELGVVNEA